MTDSPGYEIAINDAGEREVSWWIYPKEGRMRMKHTFPDALSHYYEQSAENQPIALYRGRFQLPDDTTELTGEVVLRWLPDPEVFVSGTAHVPLRDAFALFSMRETVDTFWEEPQDILLVDPRDDGRLLPPVLDYADEATDTAPNRHSDTIIGPQEYGDGAVLDSVRFLLPNGWHSRAGARAICDPLSPVSYWYGQTESQGGGWHFLLDERKVNSPESARKSFRRTRANVVTHVGELSRIGGGTFSADESSGAVKAINIACRIALARESSLILPVGYLQGNPVWTRWAAPRLSPYGKVATWLDDAVTADQTSELVSKLLELTEDPFKLNTVHYAAAYLTGAHKAAAEASTSLCISGLTMLAHFLLVQELALFSESQFSDKRNGFDAEGQIRQLLQHVGIDIPKSVERLLELQQVGQIAKLNQRNRVGDALSGCVFLRNRMIHPTRRMPDEYSVYAWGEASELLKHFLTLALLHVIAYEGKYRSYLHGQYMPSSATQVPWVGA